MLNSSITTSRSLISLPPSDMFSSASSTSSSWLVGVLYFFSPQQTQEIVGQDESFFEQQEIGRQPEMGGQPEMDGQPEMGGQQESFVGQQEIGGQQELFEQLESFEGHESFEQRVSRPLHFSLVL